MKCDYSNEGYLAAPSCATVCFAVQGGHSVAYSEFHCDLSNVSYSAIQF